MSSVLLRGALVAACALPLVALVPATASAAATRPAVPTGERIVDVGHSTATVTVGRTAGTTSYRLYVSTRRADLHLATVARAHHSPAVRNPRMTMTGLSYSSAVYYFRVGAFRGTQHRYSAAIGSFRLRPSVPTGVRAGSSGTRVVVVWTPAAATAVQVQQAVDPAFRRVTGTYSSNATAPSFTPFGLARGHRAWFRVRALNVTTPSAWSGAASVVPPTSEQAVSVMTYNLLEGRFAGTVEPGGEVIAPWERRRDGIATLIRQAAPDVVSVQEGAGWVGAPEGYGGTRQVDDLVHHLAGYALAHTEIAPDTHGYRRTGVYVLYRTAAWQAVGDGGHWNTGSGGAEHFAAYQLLRNVRTGARLVAVSAHLPAGAGRAADVVRQQEARSLLRQGSAYAGSVRAPIVYAGDFNSHPGSNHPLDGPGVEMRRDGIGDALTIAQIRSNARWNSCNQYLRTPPAAGRSIDHVFAPSGVGVRSAAVVLRLVRNRFVGVIPSDHNPVLAGLTIRY